MGAPAERPRDRDEKRGAIEGRARKESPFICKVEYRTKLPKVPLDIDAKLMKPPAAHPNNFVEYQTTSLDALYHCDPAIGADMGIFLDTMTPSAMRLRAGEVELLPLRNEDAVLMSDELPRRRVEGRSGARGAKGPTWYLKTSYLSNKVAEFDGDVKLTVKEEEATYGLQDQSVADTFNSVRETPVHPRKPGLKALRVTPIVPIEADGVGRMHIQFDGNPFLGVRSPLAGADSVSRMRAARQGIVKGFPGIEERSIVSALLCPVQGSELEEVGGNPAIEYDWRSDFTEEKRHLDGDFCIFKGEDGENGQSNAPFLYTGLALGSVMKKRKIKELEKESGGIRKPTVITVERL